MEKSLNNIEKSLSKSGAGGTKTDALGGLATSLDTLVDALSSKKFDSKKASDIIGFTKSLVRIANTVDVKSARAFQGFTSGLSDAFETILKVMSPVNILKLAIASKMLFDGKDSILKKIVRGMTDAFQGMDASKARDGAKAISFLGEGMLSLTKALKGLIIIGVAAPIVAIGALVAITAAKAFMSLVEGRDAKKVEAGGKALGALGKAMITFSAGLATVVLVTMVAGPVRILEAIAVVAAFSFTFALIGKAAEGIRKGATAFAFVGLAIFGFSAALASLSLVMMLVPPQDLLMGIGIVGSFAAAFYVMGKYAPTISEGALVMILGVSLGLFLFSGALMFFQNAIAKIGWKEVGLGLLLIGSMGALFSLFGEMSPEITAGSAAFGEIGLSLATLSLGLMVFGVALKLYDLKTVGIGAALLVGIGVSFAILGTMAASVTAGVATMAEMGMGLAFFSGGILAYGLAIKGLMWLFEKDYVQGIATATGILLGLGLAFAGIGVFAVPIGAGAAAMMTVGIALLSISAGILVFGLAIKALQAIFKDDLINAGVIGGAILIGLGVAFSAIGVMAPLLALGAASAVLLGGSLIITSVGLLVFGGAMKLLKNADLLEDDKKEGGKKLLGMEILPKIASEFASIGKYAIMPSFWAGVATSIGMGAALRSIGEGLESAAGALTKGISISDLQTKVFGENGLIPSIASSFAEIGKKTGSSLLSKFMGTDDVSMGIRVSRGMGEVLKELAGGIAAFANFEKFPITTPDGKGTTVNLLEMVGENGKLRIALVGPDGTSGILTALTGIFAKIGKENPQESGWFAKDGDVQKGVNAVKGIGSVLSEIAGGIIAFGNFENFPVKEMRGGKLVDTTKNLFTFVGPGGELEKALTGDGKNPGILTSLSGIFADIGNKYGGESGWFGKDSPVKKGIDAVKGIGGVLSELAGGIIAFGTMDTNGVPVYGKDGKITGYQKLDYNAVQASITSVLTMLPNIISKINFGDEKASKNKIEQLKSMTSIIADLAKSGDGLKGFADNLAKAGNAFGTFSAGFDKFAPRLDNFTKFSDSFKNIVAGQSKFDDFAKSMGTLKGNVNTFNVENLKLTESLMKSLAILSKNPDSVGKQIKDSLETALKQLVEALNSLEKTTKEAGQNASIPGADNLTQMLSPMTKPAAPEAKTSQPQPQNYTDLINAVNLMRSSIDSMNSKIKSGKGGAILVENKS